MRLPATLLRDCISGFVVSLVAVSFYVSCAALLFQGQLVAHVPVAIGMGLAGGAILALVGAWRGSIGLASLGAEPATVPVLTAMTAAIAAQCAPEAALPTAVVGLAVSAVAIGLSWFLLGYYRIGGLVRYIPYPVVGGFLAAIGWLMFSGGIGVIAGRPFSLGLLADVVTQGPPAPLVAGIVVAAVFWFSVQRIKHVLLLPGLILGASLGVYGWFVLRGMDVATARAAGWLMPEFARSMPVWALQPSVLQAVDWEVLSAQWGVVASAVIVSTIGLLLSNSSLELAWDERAESNADLRAFGIGNVALACVGGLVGGISISRSLLNREAGAATRVSGVVKAVICLVAMVAGGPVIALMPKAVLGALLIMIGTGMLKGWLVDGRSRLGRTDYAVVVVIVVLTMAVGYLPAVAAGVVICCFDFAISSARLGPVRRILTRNDWPGRVERGGRETALLRRDGERLRIVELQGTLFFGSAQALVNQLEQMLGAGEGRIDQLVLDFRRVTAMDSSAAQALTRLLKVARKHGVGLVFSAVPPAVHGSLKANGCLPPGGPVVQPDIDTAMAAWEDRHLMAHTGDNTPPLDAWLEREMGSPGLAQQLLQWLERVDLQPGDVLFTQGEPAEALYLVESGRLSVTLHRNGHDFPVRTIQAGAPVGEMGLYREGPRSATVRADVHSKVLRMTQDVLRRIEAEQPELAAQLHRMFVRLLATRLEHANANANALAA